MGRFQRTGSREFGRPCECADLDLYGQDSPEIRAELSSKGYRRLQISDKLGPNVACMMRHGRGGRGNVDIALYKSKARKQWENRVAHITPISLIMRYAPKPIRERVWGVIQSL